MKRSPLTLAAAVAVALLLVPCVIPCFAAEVGTDSAKATAYAKEWTDKSDGTDSGDAFGPWYFVSTPKGSKDAGYSIGDSRTLAPDSHGANVNTDGKSFSLAGKRLAGGKNVEAAVYREFKGGGLSPGQTFSIDLAVNYRNGYKGIDLRSGEEGKSQRKTLLNFNVGGDAYTVSNAATGNGQITKQYKPDSRFHIEFKQTTEKGGSWTIKRNDGAGEGEQATGTYEGVPTGIKLYCSGTDGGKEDMLYFNNLAISK